MLEIESRIYSDGLRLDARLYVPDDHIEGRRYPLVVACSGFTGLYRIHPARFARRLTRTGIACLGFDYRGHGASEGPRHRVIPEEQVRDIRAAVSICSGLPQVDERNVFVLGWAMGAGFVIDAVRELDEVRGVAAINGLYDGLAFLRAHLGRAGLADYRRRVARERATRAMTGVITSADPFEIYPLDESTRDYVTASLEPVDDYDVSASSLELAESLLRWSVLPTAPGVRLPLFLAHGEENALHPPGQAISLAEAYGGPIDVHWLPSVGHTEWMADENPTFIDLCGRLRRWLETRGAS